MLKTKREHQIQMVQQPHHAEISGYLAAHWGGVNGFSRPGHYPGAVHPTRWREEVVVGIGEHDNGWWEWEAIPNFSSDDGLPVGLGERVDCSQRNELKQWRSGGFERWRKGIDRLEASHPYAALMISLHAYWLYAVEFKDLIADDSVMLRHFVFRGQGESPRLVHDQEVTRRFLEEQLKVQERLKSRLAKDLMMAGSESPQHLNPHIRLLQLLDSMSLFMALNDRDDHEFEEVPRGHWDDRVTIKWRVKDSQTIVLEPYPFDLDPLPVSFPARLVPSEPEAVAARRESPYASLFGAPFETVEFRLMSGGF